VVVRAGSTHGLGLLLHAGIGDSHEAHLLDPFRLELLHAPRWRLLQKGAAAKGEVTYRHDLLLVGPLLVRAAAALRAEEQLVGIW